ncbi:helix-turn-helix domain-containing protein [Candidatus Binatus sp.]|jgi:hypothetical protein|uniref:helix-turn-helix domain-containing protein n=1 Tax=Candidatus Binatus sp. TaxID=2811406 RepID=UPI003BD729B8
MPTIEEIARDPSRVRGLSTDAIAALMARSAAVQGTLSAALILLGPSAKPNEPEEPSDDKMLTIDEAALRLRRSRRWIYRHAHVLPFVKRLSPRNLLCSERKLTRWLEQCKA